jgi:hypothetical protein
VNVAVNSIQGIIDKHGHIITTVEGINAELIGPLKDLYTSNEVVTRPWGFESYRGPVHPMFTYANITDAIANVKFTKAIGPDLCDWDAVKCGGTAEDYGTFIMKQTALIYNWMNKINQFPQWVKKSRIVALPKGGKNVVTTDNVRFLSMTSMHCRVIEKALVDKFH